MLELGPSAPQEVKCIDVKAIQVSVLTRGVEGGADGPGRGWPLTAETNFIPERALPKGREIKGESISDHEVGSPCTIQLDIVNLKIYFGLRYQLFQVEVVLCCFIIYSFP